MPTVPIPGTTIPEQFQVDVDAGRAALSRGRDVWDRYQHVILTAIIAGFTARYIGRPVAKIENTLIGGIAAGFSALRDPRDTLWKQLLVALGYGMTWGLTDVYWPVLLNTITGSPPPPELPGEGQALPNVPGAAMAGLAPRRRYRRTQRSILR